MHVRYASNALEIRWLARKVICSVKSASIRTSVSSRVISCAAYSDSDTVTQLDDIKRQKAKLDALKREAEEEKQRAREAARERVLLDFEKGQLGLSGPARLATTSGSESTACECISNVTLPPTNFLQRAEPRESLSLTPRRWKHSRGRLKKLRYGK